MTVRCKILAMIPVLFLKSACTGQSGPGVSVGSSAASNSTQAVGNAAGTQATASQPVDGSTLQVWNVRVASFMDKMTPKESLTFTPDANADSVNYQLCPLAATGNCFKGTTLYNVVTIPTLWAGKIQVQVQACVDASHATSSTLCGSWSQPFIYNSQYFNAQAAALEQDIASDEQSIKNLAENDYRNALIAFVNDANQCNGLNAEVKAVLDNKVRVIQQFIRMPVAWFGDSAQMSIDALLGQGATGTILGSVDSAYQDFKNQLLKPLCNTVGQSTASWVCPLLTSVGASAPTMLMGMSPVPGIAMASNSIQDIVLVAQGNEGSLAAYNCSAEENFQRAITNIQAQIQTNVQMLKDANTQLQALTGQGSSSGGRGSGSQGSTGQ